MMPNNPFAGFGETLRRGAVGFGAGLAGGGAGAALMQNLFEQQERERQEQALNPFREQVLGMLTNQQAFAGEPMPQEPDAFGQDFAGAPAVPPPRGGQVTPHDPRPELARLPEDLRPPPEVDTVLQRSAERYGVPVNMLRALAAQESNFRAGVVGGTPIDLPGQEGDRARGMFQFTPQEIARIRRNEFPGFDPNNPEHAADETARRLRLAMEEGKTPDIAMMEHFGGPDPSLHGPRTRKYHQEITEKFQRLEQALPSVPGGQPEQQAAQQPARGEGPFGTQLGTPPAEQNPVHALMASVAQDPAAFSEMFANPDNFEKMLSMLGGGGGSEQVRVISGDSAEGRAIGLASGERARVKGNMTPNGTFMPTEVVAQPFGGNAEGGTLVTLVNMRDGEAVSRRRDDPEVDQLVQSGYVVASDGTSLERLQSIPESDRKAFTEGHVATKNYIDTVGDALTLLGQQPDINTFVAKAGALINDLRQETRAAGRALGMEFDESIFDVSVHQDSFRQLGIDNERMQSLITSLAFQRAVAEKGGTGRITNRDIERFIAELGGRRSDPLSLAQTLIDTAERGARAFRTSFEIRTGAPFEGDLGLERLPRFNESDFEQAAQRAAGGGQAAQRAAGGGQAAQRAAGGGQAGVAEAMPTLTDDEAGDAVYESLPSGAQYIAPDGSIREKR